MLDKKISNYYNTDSNIHKINPIIKIISLLLYLILFLLVNNLVFSFIMLIFSLILIELSKVPYRLYLIRSIPISILCSIILLFSIVFNPNGLTLILKLLAFSLYYSTYIYTTKFVETNKGLYDILVYIDLYDYRTISFFFILIHFVQIVFIEYFNIIKIQISRNSKDINFISTIFYSFRKTKDKLKIIRDSYKNKEYNFKFKYKTNKIIDYSVITAHLLLFFVYFLGKI